MDSSMNELKRSGSNSKAFFVCFFVCFCLSELDPRRLPGLDVSQDSEV